MNGFEFMTVSDSHFHFASLPQSFRALLNCLRTLLSAAFPVVVDSDGIRPSLNIDRVRDIHIYGIVNDRPYGHTWQVWQVNDIQPTVSSVLRLSVSCGNDG